MHIGQAYLDHHPLSLVIRKSRPLAPNTESASLALKTIGRYFEGKSFSLSKLRMLSA